MITVAKKMIAENKLCVLSTCCDNQPNTSLMQYICDPSCTKLFMLTLKGSLKFNNIADNPNVSLLIDTREAFPYLSDSVKSLTIYGQAEFIEEAKLHQELLSQLTMASHNLSQLARAGNCQVFQVTAQKFLLQDDASNGIYINV